ncbi:MAG: ParA family protein [Bacteroidota bacterium]
MPVVTVANHKGGTGKTTSSIHIAAALGHQGRRVLVIDFDPQGFLTRMMGEGDLPVEQSSLGLLDAEADLGQYPVRSVSGFDLIGSTLSLTKAARSLTRPTDVLWLKDTIRAGHGYDVILVDTAAALSVYTMNALVASDLLVIPVTPEYQPVVGAEQTWQTAGLVQDKLNPSLATPRFLLTQVDARLNRHARYAEYLRTKYGEAVLETPIRTSSSLAVASRDGRTVFDTRHETRGAADYRDAAAEIGALLDGAFQSIASSTGTPASVFTDVAPPDARDSGRPRSASGREGSLPHAPAIRAHGQH